MSERGFIAVDRGVFEHPVFAPEPFTEREAWLWMIAEAAWKPTRVRIGKVVMDLARGQLAHSLRFMAARWRWSEPRVRRFLSRLKAESMVDVAPTRDTSLLTICNYDNFQYASNIREIDAPSDAPATHKSTHPSHCYEREFQDARRTDEVEIDAPNDALATQSRTREQSSSLRSEGYAVPRAPESARELDHETLGRVLVEAGGEALANPATAPNLLVLSEPKNWIASGCDLSEDILPTIRARCSRMRPYSVRSWAFFRDAVFQARDTRLRPAPDILDDQRTRPPPRNGTPSDPMLAALARRARAHAEAGGSGEREADAAPPADGCRTIELVPLAR